jgi:hypothetical protein
VKKFFGKKISGRKKPWDCIKPCEWPKFKKFFFLYTDYCFFIIFSKKFTDSKFTEIGAAALILQALQPFLRPLGFLVFTRRKCIQKFMCSKHPNLSMGTEPGKRPGLPKGACGCSTIKGAFINGFISA